MARSKYYRRVDMGDTTATYDVLDPNTAAVAGFFVLDRQTGNVADSSIGPFGSPFPLTLYAIAALVWFEQLRLARVDGIQGEA